MNLKIISVLFFLISLAHGTISAVEHEKVKVLFVVEKFPYSLQTFIINQMTGLIDRGFDIKIFAQIAPDSFMPDVLQPYDFTDRVFYRSVPSGQGDFDIILCQLGGSASRCLSLIHKKMLSGKLLVCFRGYDLSGYIKFYRNAYDEVMKKADLLLPVCDYFADRLRSMGAPSNKVITHHSSIDLKKFAFKERSIGPDNVIHLITVCRLVEMKGLEYAIRAVAQVARAHENIEYTIVGGGDLYDSLVQVIEELGMNNKIKLVGRKAHEEVVQLLDQSHIFIHPSITAKNGSQEGIPNGIQEAMAMGLPVVSTYHSGIPELVEHGVSGLLAPEKDVAMLAEHLLYLIKHPDRWAAMGRAGRAKIEQAFDMEKENDILAKLLLSVVSNA
ncbi:glycosyltransferase [bacterium]|nr:MAG: glycosyltransferase [bacterium]